MAQVQIACQLSFSPIGVEDYNREIGRVLELIKGCGLSVDIGPMSTIIRGSSEKVFALLEDIVKVQAQSGLRYVMNMAISNTCGCT